MTTHYSIKDLQEVCAFLYSERQRTCGNGCRRSHCDAREASRRAHRSVDRSVIGHGARHGHGRHGLVRVPVVAMGWPTDRASVASTKAVIRTGKLNDIAMQRNAVHVHLFVQWVAAGSTGNTWLADFLFKRFPEPLKSATVAWQATHPLTNPSAPASPFDMPEYVLHDRG